MWKLITEISGYKYINLIQVAKNITLPKTAVGCNCKGTCIDPRTCACAKLNGSDFPYVQRDGGRWGLSHMKYVSLKLI